MKVHIKEHGNPIHESIDLDEAAKKDVPEGAITVTVTATLFKDMVDRLSRLESRVFWRVL